ncbi:hypothetical protein DYB30_011367, partial [Aphanomyces astaci]
MSLALFKGALNTCSVSPYNYGLGTGTPVNPPWFPTDYTGDFNIVNVTVLEELDVMTFPRPWTKLTDPQKDAIRPVWNQPGCGPFADDDTPTSRDICLCFAGQNGTSWNPQTPQRFDNIFYAITGLFELTTMEGWTSVALACIDAVGENMQPIANFNPAFMIYWWIFIIICAFFITGLFIGVLCDSFARETYGSLVTDEQIQWIKLQNKVLAMSPQHVFPCPTHPIRRAAFVVCTYGYFEHFITFVILLNTACMAVQVFGQSVATETALNALNSICSVIFIFEAAAKLASYAIGYFEDGWNRFDIVIVLLTIVSLILQAFSIDVGSAASVIRVFRVGRALRLIKKAKIMKNLFDTLIVSLPAVVNVVSLLSLLYYIFAAVAVQLFAKTGFDGNMINENQSFQNFWTAFQTLIGFSTGENWDNFTWEVYNQVPATNPTCEDRSYNASMCGFNDTYGCVPLDGCGSGMILPFMYFFFLVMGYIGINLFSGIVVDAIGDASNDSRVNVNTLAEFSDRWAQFDPSGSGLITADELTDFLYTVYPPFGFKGVPGFTRRKVAIVMGDLGIPIYDKIYVHFKDVPRALVQRVLAEGDRAKHAEITRIMEQLGINKHFDEMWFRSHGKKHQNTLIHRQQVTAREYSATLVIQRFFEKVKLERQRRRNLARIHTYGTDITEQTLNVGRAVVARDMDVESVEANERLDEAAASAMGVALDAAGGEEGTAVVAPDIQVEGETAQLQHQGGSDVLDKSNTKEPHKARIQLTVDTSNEYLYVQVTICSNSSVFSCVNLKRGCRFSGMTFQVETTSPAPSTGQQRQQTSDASASMSTVDKDNPDKPDGDGHRISLGCLTTKNPIRRICIRIVSWKWFDRFIVFCVIFNTIILGLTDYTDAWVDGPNSTIWINWFIDKCNYVSFYIFLAEATFKVIAMGFCFGERAYFSEGWNRLDFVIVVSGYVLAKQFGGIGVVVFTLLTNSLLASLPALANVFVLLMFCTLVFAILGMEMYRGAFHYRCRVTPYPVKLPPNGTLNYPPDAAYIALVQSAPHLYQCMMTGNIPITQNMSMWPEPQDCFWPTDPGETTPKLCNPNSVVGRQCQPDFVCGSNYDIEGSPRFTYMELAPWNQSSGDDALFNSNLNYGFTSFDNLGRSAIIILQTLTASGWMVLTQTTQTTGSPVVGGIFFTVLMYVGMCFLLQLNMAVLFSEFEKAKELQAKLLLKELQRKSVILASLPPDAGSAKHRSAKLPDRTTTNSLTSTQPGDVAVQSSLRRRFATLRARMHVVVTSKKFINFGLLVTVANIIILALDHHDIDLDSKAVYEKMNFTFMLYFGMESIMKMLGLGFRHFW